MVTIDAIFVFIFSCFFYISFYYASLTDPGSVPIEYIERHVGLSQIFKRIYNDRSIKTSSSLFRTSALPPNVRGRVTGSEITTGSDLAKRSKRLSSRRIRTMRETKNTRSISTTDISSELSTPPTSTIKNEKKNESTSITVKSLSSTLSSSSINPQMAVKQQQQQQQQQQQLNLIPIRVSELDLNALDEPGPHDPRWCSKCSQIKPPRTHHCSMCMRCVTKMDHHCPWVGNCVGFQNYKAFILLLIHGFSAAVFSLLIWAPLMSGIWMPFSVSSDTTTAHPEALKEANARFALGYTDVMDMFAFTLDASLCCSLMVLLGMHIYLISAGKTTLEATWRGVHPYDLGSFRANWESVMGKRPLFWFVPFCISTEILKNTRSGTEWRANQIDLFEYPLPRKGELEQIFGNTQDEDETEFDINDDDDDDNNDEEANMNEEHVGLISS